MKGFSQIQKFISLLMIFYLLLYFSGCHSTKIISKSDLLIPNSSKYFYLVHCEQLKYLLEKSTISNDTLSGKIIKIYADNSNDKGKIIHLYLLSDSVVSMDKKGEHLSVPLNGIAQVCFQEIKGVGLFFIGFGSGLLLWFAFLMYLSRSVQ